MTTEHKVSSRVISAPSKQRDTRGRREGRKGGKNAEGDSHKRFYAKGILLRNVSPFGDEERS
jgi:hypothetical protein